MDPALALIEFDSIASGIEAGDAMAKKAPVAGIVAGTVQPGKFLVLVHGVVADVEESLLEGLRVGASSAVDSVYLPGVHPDVVDALSSGRSTAGIEALGIVETRSVAAAIAAADAGVKGAEVELLELRLADGLGGKGLVFFIGQVADVEAAVQIGTAVIAGSGALVRAVVIPRLHADMSALLLEGTRWRPHIVRLAGR